jgi:hypothetical protein
MVVGIALGIAWGTAWVIEAVADAGGGADDTGRAGVVAAVDSGLWFVGEDFRTGVSD